jgi:hypothetical protein
MGREGRSFLHWQCTLKCSSAAPACHPSVNTVKVPILPDNAVPKASRKIIIAVESMNEKSSGNYNFYIAT